MHPLLAILTACVPPVRTDRSAATADFDGDGDVGTDADIDAFFEILGGVYRGLPSDVLVPGDGFASPTEQPPAAGAPDDLGYDAKAIARWDVIPHQDVGAPLGDRRWCPHLPARRRSRLHRRHVVEPDPRAVRDTRSGPRRVA